MGIGKRLRKWRRINGLSLRDAAQRIGVTHPTILAIERGGHTPSPRVATAIARTLGVPIADVYGVPR